jgi:hypothetical protein
MNGDERQFPGAVVELQDAEIRDHRAQRGRPRRRRDEVDAIHERLRRVPRHDQHLAHPRCDLRRPPGAGETQRRVRVVANHRGVEIAAAVDLRRPEDGKIDAPGLQPITEQLGHADETFGRFGQLVVGDREWRDGRGGADSMDCNDVSPAISRTKTYDFGNLLIGK